MRVEWYVSAAVGLVIGSGCIREREPVQSPAASPHGTVATNAINAGRQRIVTPEGGLDGQVAWADSNLRFVVITFPLGQAPALNRRLSVYRGGLKVGEVKITGPQRDDSIVGDLIVGEAGLGDAVRDR